MEEEKRSILGIEISPTSYADIQQSIDECPKDRALTVCVCNVHSVMSARKDAALREALHASDITTPDGMPLVWYLRRTGRRDQARVYGPELMRRTIIEGVRKGWKHYLLGSTPETLQALRRSLETLAPGVELVGWESPPFRSPSAEEERATLDRIRESGAHLVWVGLGMPKQEIWMHRNSRFLPGLALVGVGAAFDFLAGTKPQAPKWIQDSGLEWLFRFLSEPRRLWKRYVWNNPAFLVLATLEVARTRKTPGRD